MNRDPEYDDRVPAAANSAPDDNSVYVSLSISGPPPLVLELLVSLGWLSKGEK